MTLPEHCNRTAVVTFRGEDGFCVFDDLETVLRLGPQWTVEALRVEENLCSGMPFEVDVEFDSSEQKATLAGTVERHVPGRLLAVTLVTGHATLRLFLSAQPHISGHEVEMRFECDPTPSLHALREFDMWARSILNYMQISAGRGFFTKMWKYFLDRWWLKMPQFGKRIVIIVLIGEAFSLAMLIGILLWWKIF
ncbi:MAG: hypothetical protein Q8R89_04700 [Desulfomicrobium sp.]|nr:hypothetical protein [Desulfomicrobium sp.]